MFLFVLLFGLTIQNAFSQSSKPFSINESPLPAPTAPVNDYAGVLDENTKSQLNQRIIEFRDKSNPKVELAVAIVKTTGDRDIYDYSTAVARGWGIGSKQDDNPGALLFVAIDDRKYFTQVSRDLEDELPDGLVGSLQRQYLVPAFKQGNYGKGISDTIDAYIKTIQAKQSGEPAPIQTPETNRKKSGGSFFGGAGCMILLLILMIIIFSRGGRGGGRGGRGGGGGGLGSALPWIIGSAIANSGGSSGGSSWGGGGSSGGGWGGFGGGGDFGGGGAGGSW
ncbi:MAG: TPM domain-containing protein [Acidobacteriota bacterium]